MLGLNNIYCGECADLMRRRIPDECIHLVITSPPYEARNKKVMGLRKYGGYTFDFEPIATELARVLVPGGVIVWVIGEKIDNYSESGESSRQRLFFMDELGLCCYQTLHWDRAATPVPTTGRYYKTHEFMYVFSKGKPRVINLIADRPNIHTRDTTARSPAKDGERAKVVEHRKRKGRAFGTRRDIWIMHTGSNLATKFKEAFRHPAIFPENLARDHIISWSNPGDIVLDPMCGSGTTLVEADILDRNWIGIDIYPGYCRLSRRRVDNIVRVLQARCPTCDVIFELRGSQYHTVFNNEVLYFCKQSCYTAFREGPENYAAGRQAIITYDQLSFIPLVRGGKGNVNR